MKEFIDKLIGRLEENIFVAELYGFGWEGQRVGNLLCLGDVKDIAEELAEEYKGGWIACKEEMPSQDGNYLVCDAQGNIYIARYYAGSTTFKRNVGYVARAWCELPTPYTEGE